jgi:hypothetical protein
MQLGKGGAGLPEDKKQLVIIGAAVLVILIAGFMLYRSVTGGGGGNYAAPSPESAPAGGSSGSVARAPYELTGDSRPRWAPGAQEGDINQPTGSGQQSPGSAASAPPQPAPAPAKVAVAPAPPDKFGMRHINVFGTVGIGYPQNWKIKAGAGNRSAVFTDGNAVFEVLSPDPKATSAKAIAESARMRLAKRAAVTAQGPDKIAGYDAYWMAVRVGGKTARIVGVDGSTRVVLFERVGKGDFAAYRDAFNKIQARITFTK